jgi:hypothetical protein
VDSGDGNQEDKGQSQVPDTSEAPLSQQEPNSLAGDALAEAALKDPKAAEKLRRQFQSDKDKGVAQATKDAQEARTLVEQLARKFGEDDPGKIAEIQREIVLDQLVAERTGVTSEATVSEQASPEVRATASKNDITQAFTDAAWDMGKISREDLEFATQFQGSQADLKNSLLERRVLGAQQRETSPASVVQTSGNASFGGSSIDQLVARQTEILSDSQLASTEEGLEELLKIAAQMEELGQ